MARPKKIVIATDVRFWKRATGAHQRIHAMVEYLSQQGHQVTTLLVASLSDDSAADSNEKERAAIRNLNLNVVSLIDDWTPKGFVSRCVWQAKCIINWLFSSSKATEKNDIRAIQPRRLSDFGSSMLQRRMNKFLARIDPDVVLAEYITMAWLVPFNKTSEGPQWWVDTHDHLSERARQFNEYGHSHWLEISEKEEIQALSRFDRVIAIQPDEANSFRQLLGKDPPVFVAGHPSPKIANSKQNRISTPEYSLGYFGSNNPSNVDAVEWFFEQVWPKVLEGKPDATFRLAGAVCQSFSESGTDRSVSRLPYVEDVAGLYQSFQVAINPVRFGTGLKIKNQESLAFGKPLIVTAQGATGMVLPDSAICRDAIHITSSADDMAESVVRLLNDEDQLQRAQLAAEEYARQYLTPDFVFRELMENLNSIG